MFKAIAFLLSLTFLTSAALSQEKRKSAPQLFPDNAIAYLRVNDVTEFKEKLSQSATGKILAEPKLQRFFGTFYQGVGEAAKELQNAIGISLDELLALPTGELAFAVIPTAKQPIFCLMVDVGGELPIFELFIKKVESRSLEREGRTKSEKQIGDLKISKISGGGRPDLGYFLDGSVFVFAMSTDYIDTLANIWVGNGVNHKPLSENASFTTLLSRCVGTQGERPQISFYTDPVGIFRETIRNSPNALVTLATIKTLGIDGLKALGGSVILSTQDFDSVLHLDIAMDQPRPGVLNLIRPKSGSTEPESWVSDNVVAYATANWDVKATLSGVREIVDMFAGEGTLDSNLASISKTFGVEFKKDFLDQLTGRMSLVSVVLPERKVNAQSNIIAFHVKDSELFTSRVLEKYYESSRKRDTRWSKKEYQGVNIYFLNLPQRESEFVRAPQPSYCMIKNTVVTSDSSKTLENLIDVNLSQEALLSDSIEFRLIHDKIKAQMQGKDFSIMSYNRPDEQLRLFYDMAKDPKVVERLERSAESNAMIAALTKALRDGELPPFEELAKFIAPTGAFVTEELEGLHYTAFTLKRQ